MLVANKRTIYIIVGMTACAAVYLQLEKAHAGLAGCGEPMRTVRPVAEHVVDHASARGSSAVLERALLMNCSTQNHSAAGPWSAASDLLQFVNCDSLARSLEDGLPAVEKQDTNKTAMSGEEQPI